MNKLAAATKGSSSRSLMAWSLREKENNIKITTMVCDCVCGKASGKCESSISQAAVHWQWEKPNKADKAAAVHLRVWAL